MISKVIFATSSMSFHCCSRVAIEQHVKRWSAAVSGDTMTGAKHQVCLIELFLCLRKLNVSSKILETAVRISEILYMFEEHRNPRNILRLYNLTWLHHELCNTLITTFHGGMKYTIFFGTCTCGTCPTAVRNSLLKISEHTKPWASFRLSTKVSYSS